MVPRRIRKTPYTVPTMQQKTNCAAGSAPSNRATPATAATMSLPGRTRPLAQVLATMVERCREEEQR